MHGRFQERWTELSIMGRSVPPTKGWRVEQELYWKSSRQSTTRSWGKIFIHAEDATRAGCKIIVSETANHNVPMNYFCFNRVKKLTNSFKVIKIILDHKAERCPVAENVFKITSCHLLCLLFSRL